MDAVIATGNTIEVRECLTELIRAQAGQSTFGDGGLDETMEQIRNEMRKFAEDTVVPMPMSGI
jgi:(2S)-methylsuccinyl-CoA dehydrogenase